MANRTDSVPQAFASAIDWSAPASRDAADNPVFAVRGRVPFELAPSLAPTVSRSASLTVPKTHQRAEMMPEHVDERETGGPKLVGIASSTSCDSYGTDMSRACMEDMAKQCMKPGGVSMLASHGYSYSPPEWNEVIGTTRDATVESHEVMEPVDGEPGYVMRVVADLFEDIARDVVVPLMDRVARGQQIGLSIGGYFTDWTVVADKDTGEITRVTINKVELDHIAITRRPSNPDAKGLDVVRTLSADSLRAARLDMAPGPGDPIAQDPDDAHRGAPPEDVDTRSEAGQSPPEAPMPDNTPDPVLALLQEMRADINALKAPAPAEPDVDLRAQLTALQADIAALKEQPQRRGMHAAPSPTPAPPAAPQPRAEDANALRELALRVAESPKPAPHLCAVVTRAADLIMDDTKPRSQAQLQDALYAIFRAAESDGLITDPAIRAGWN